MAKTKENPNHHMGKRTGYDLINGEYHIAPGYSQQLDMLVMRWVALDEMLKMITKHISTDLEQIHKERWLLFKEIADDIGIDISTGDWAYKSGTICQIERNKEQCK